MLFADVISMGSFGGEMLGDAVMAVGVLLEVAIGLSILSSKVLFWLNLRSGGHGQRRGLKRRGEEPDDDGEDGDAG